MRADSTDFTAPGAMTSAGRYAPLLCDLPRNLPELAGIVQGLLLHEHFAPAYGVELSEERRAETHIRPAAGMLEALLAKDDAPLNTARPPGSRLVGICRHFTVLLVAMLRAHGIPARARCGFGAYFNQGRFEDHWVCEYRRAEDGRWVLADAQIDNVQRAILEPDFDLMDVPRDRFLVAGDAWAQCRSGRAEPEAFGIFDMRGLWFVAGNLLRDLAALNDREMLPWDVWGAMFRDDEQPSRDVLALCDRIAGLTGEPDTPLGELRSVYENDARLRVPSSVFNARLNRLEPV